MAIRRGTVRLSHCAVIFITAFSKNRRSSLQICDGHLESERVVARARKVLHFGCTSPPILLRRRSVSTTRPPALPGSEHRAHAPPCSRTMASNSSVVSRTCRKQQRKILGNERGDLRNSGLLRRISPKDGIYRIQEIFRCKRVGLLREGLPGLPCCLQPPPQPQANANVGAGVETTVEVALIFG